jgi:hypothetical protein
MPKYKRDKLRLGVLGASGIGKVHVRIFRSLGFEVSSILGSSLETVNRTAADLYELFRITPTTYTDIHQFVAQPLDAVSICTPPELHYEQILLSFQSKLPVFCEKPLFWNNEWPYYEIKKKLSILEEHPHRCIFLNTSNTVFADQIRNMHVDVDSVKEFNLKFYTQGTHVGRNIAVDLLPHGLSILTTLFGHDQPHAISYNITKHSFLCNFRYRNVSVVFNFQQNQNGSKLLSFFLDGHEYRRVQFGQGQSYKVFLLDVQNKNMVPIEDPFSIYISRFTQRIRENIPEQGDDFPNAENNLGTMAKMLENIDHV